MRRFLVASLLTALGLVGPGAALAEDGPQLTGVRVWSSPQSTRVVYDLSYPAPHVSPDSGASASLVVSVPGAVLAPGGAVPRQLSVRDTVLDSVWVETSPQGLFLHMSLPAERTFHVFTLDPEDDKPYRLVVDFERPGASAELERRLQRIATLKQQRTRIVAIDAGHGGEDSGARGPGRVLEKTVTLAVAKALMQELNRLPGIKAVLTRDGDYFIPLGERFRMAERMKADMFISIHANSSPRRTRGRNRGTEVYFLSLRGASDQAAHDLADLENAADMVGGVPNQAEDELVSILYDVKRTSVLQQSQILAEHILDQIAEDRRLASRGVKQAAFAVLKSVEFPSVLVETAFINNPTEVRLLRDPAFQRQMARQISNGVKLYFGRVGVNLGAMPADRAEASR